MRESMEFDVVIVGGGPSGLSAAIRLATLARENNTPLTIAVIEKGSAIGSHILSGAVIEPRALNELLPDWESKNPPLHTKVTHDAFLWLTEKRAFHLPTPAPMKNHGHWIVSLGEFCRWFARIAEELGVNIFPGFAATEVIIEDNIVKGIITGDHGVDKHHQPKANFQAGYELRAKQTIFAEGCRGSLTQTLLKRFQLTENADPQTYALGIKEVWEVPSSSHVPGKVVHTVGWPLDHATYGGSFLYHYGENLVSLGFVIGLDYQNPYLNPYETLQQFKTHPCMAPLFAEGKRIAYGARTLVEGGLQCLPKLTFPGGLLVGDAAGFLNVPKIKGTHTAMKSGLLAAESIYALLAQANPSSECSAYTNAFQTSWLHEELYLSRNIRPGFRFGLVPGLMHAAVDTYLFRGRAPWTLHHRVPDHDCLIPAANAKPIAYPKHDGQLTFDLMNSVYLTQSHTDENQPCHLKLASDAIPIDLNLKVYDAPEQRYCPAGVYEIVRTEANTPKLQIHAANCIQCKACDIKDPSQNITWTPPEGGDGPQYNAM